MPEVLPEARPSGRLLRPLSGPGKQLSLPFRGPPRGHPSADDQHGGACVVHDGANLGKEASDSAGGSPRQDLNSSCPPNQLTAAWPSFPDQWERS